MFTTRRQFTAAVAAFGALGATAMPISVAHAQSRIEEAKLMETGTLPDKIAGDPDAPVTIIEYASMTCPHCASFHNNIYPKLKEDYVDTGKVRFVFREFPLDRLAAAASMLARCVEDDQFFPFVDVLFKEQRTWATRDPIEPLKKLAKDAGLSDEGFDNCLANQELLDGLVWTKDRAETEFEVRSTPTFFVNGQLVRGGGTIEEFRQIIDSHVSG